MKNCENPGCTDDACNGRKCEATVRRKKKKRSDNHTEEHVEALAGADNAVSEQMQELKKMHRENIARAEKEIRLMNEMSEVLEAINSMEDLDTPNKEGLPPVSAGDYVHNLLIANPHGALKGLTDMLLGEYNTAREELRPTLVDYLLYPFVHERRLLIRRWKSTETIIANLQRIKAIEEGRENGDEIGVNLNNFTTYVAYLQVIRPQSTSAIFKSLAELVRQARERSEKLLKASKVLSK